MNFILHKHNTENHHVKMPDGLKELLSDISREVLRSQPDDPYDFIANYLETLMVVREESLIAKHMTNNIFDISMTISELMHGSAIGVNDARAMASIIETSIRDNVMQNSRGDVVHGNVRKMEKNLLDTLWRMGHFRSEDIQKIQQIIQACFKSYYYHEKEFTMKFSRLPNKHWANVVERTLSAYRKVKPQQWELEKAAVAIQAAYRGYYARRKPKEVTSFDRFATRIQANVRGYQARKQLDKEVRASVMIQAQYRAYRSRSTFTRQIYAILDIQSNMRTKHRTSTSKNKTKQMTQEEAAVAIQAHYRGYKTRYDLMEKMEAALKIKAKQRRVKFNSLFGPGRKTLKKKTPSARPSVQHSAVVLQEDIIVNHADEVNLDHNELELDNQMS